ncbi:MAG: hypothetical protein KGH71_05850 [Candidatus Micrarchaeota archaeon]|nr:hypothetical protein [Candidatus Micrarchaeota archaeon]MDE1870471.1 hypothetical protein [Candidatus Micrarchaeota archaeon]
MKLVSELKSLLHRGQNSMLPNASDGLNILGQVTEQEWDKIMSIQIYIEAAEYGPNLYASGGQGVDMADTVRDLVEYQRKGLNELYDATLKKYGFSKDTHRIIEDRKIVTIEDYSKFIAARDKIREARSGLVEKKHNKNK